MLRAIGLIGWLWIVAQGIAGGTSAGDVTTLFLWVYGWVGLAIAVGVRRPGLALARPVLDAPRHRGRGAAPARRRGLGASADYPERPRPLAGGRRASSFFVWLELVGMAGPRRCSSCSSATPRFTLAMMAQFGRDDWRAHGETFTVWFRLLGRLAPFALVDEDGPGRAAGPFASGLLEPGWRRADVVLVALGVGVDPLRRALADPAVVRPLRGAGRRRSRRSSCSAFLGIIVAPRSAVARLVGLAATGAGLLPIAVGYLIAHYFTYLLIDGQRIIIAIADPLQQGWDLFGTAVLRAERAGLPPGFVWTVQLAAVVGGHMLGAWGGHVVAARRRSGGHGQSALRRRQVPLAMIMVGLTTLTLWSLGQAIVVAPPS